METASASRDMLRDMADKTMVRLTDAASDRFGEAAREAAAEVAPMPAWPGWRDDDFVEVLLLRTLPWARTMIAAFGHQDIAALILETLSQPMRAFGVRAAAASDGTMPDQVAHALAPMPPEALTIENRDAAADRVAFQVTRCRYAEILQSLGVAELGPMLICHHDFAIAEGLGLRLTRPTTLMRDRLPCEFRYTRPGP